MDGFDHTSDNPENDFPGFALVLGNAKTGSPDSHMRHFWMCFGYSVHAPQVLPRFGYTLSVPQTSQHFVHFHLRLKVLQAGNIHKANPVPDRFRAGPS